MSDDEAKATDYLARTVIQSRATIGPIGFIHHKTQSHHKSIAMIKTKPKPAAKPMPSKKGGKGGEKC